MINAQRHLSTLALIACLISTLLTACSRADIQRIDEERAKTIINALDQYKQANKDFPSDLNMLVPNYLDRLPTGLGGQEYFYATDPPDGFILSFEVAARYGCGYTYTSRVWECGYGD